MNTPSATEAQPESEVTPNGVEPDEPRDSLFGLTAAQWEKGWNEALAMAAVSLAKQALARKEPDEQ